MLPGGSSTNKSTNAKNSKLLFEGTFENITKRYHETIHKENISPQSATKTLDQLP